MPSFDPSAELAAIYAEADSLYEMWSCPGSTECCRFVLSDHEPHVTSVELDALVRAARRVGVALVPSKRSLPVAKTNTGDCPLLTPNGRCAVYADRPLGCRTFYCERATAGTRVRHSEVKDLVRRLEELSQRWDGSTDKGRPLTRALASRDGRGRRP